MKTISKFSVLQSRLLFLSRRLACSEKKSSVEPDLMLLPHHFWLILSTLSLTCHKLRFSYGKVDLPEGPV